MAVCGVQAPLALARRSPILLQVRPAGGCAFAGSWLAVWASGDGAAGASACCALPLPQAVMHLASPASRFLLTTHCFIHPFPSRCPVLPRQPLAGDHPPGAAALPGVERSRGECQLLRTAIADSAALSKRCCSRYLIGGVSRLPLRLPLPPAPPRLTRRPGPVLPCRCIAPTPPPSCPRRAPWPAACNTWQTSADCTS